MITTPTVLILGAGASVPLGFPTGRKLLLDICEGLGNPNNQLCVHVEMCGYAASAQAMFRDELAASMQPSVDAFLEKRPEFTTIGKVTMSCALIPYEVPAWLMQRQKNPHWYEYLFNKMDAGWDDFGKNTVSIITFNYDRSFEHFTFEALRKSYGKSEEETAALLRTIPIVHVYGQLGQYPPLAGGQGRPYDNTVSPEVVDQSVQGIRIVHEGVDDTVFAIAHELIKNAARICFLGFGYHRNNLERLQLGNFGRRKHILGSAYDVAPAERGSILGYFQVMCEVTPQLGNELEDVLRTLRTHLVLEF